MERARYGYHGRVSVLIQQQQQEASRAALRAEADKEKEESLRKEKQYWVRFKQITIDDVNTLLGIYEKLTEYSPSPIEEEDFNRFRKEFISDYGFSEFPIQTGTNLEIRKRISDTGELFARLKISGGYKVLHEKGKVKNVMQNEIDTYFLSKNMAVTLRQTY